MIGLGKILNHFLIYFLFRSVCQVLCVCALFKPAIHGHMFLLHAGVNIALYLLSVVWQM